MHEAYKCYRIYIQPYFAAAGAVTCLEPVIDLSRMWAVVCEDEHDKEVVSQRRDGCGMGVSVALFDVDA